MLKLYDYQIRGIDEGRALLAKGKRSILFVAATGAGKTVCFSHIVESGILKGSRAVVLAPRQEIIHQTYAKLMESGLRPVDVGIQMGSVSDRREVKHEDPWIAHARARPLAPVQLGIVNSFTKRKWVERNTIPDIIIIDEAHKATSPMYRKFIDACRAQRPDVVVLGFTATPFSKHGFEDLFDELVVIAGPRQLATTINPATGQPFLMWPRVLAPPMDKIADVSEIKIDKTKDDYEEKALATASNQPHLLGSIVDHWIREANGMRTVAFAVNIEHSKAIAARFVAAGIPAEHLDGESFTAVERKAILDRLRTGETKVVTNCMTLPEGWDLPVCGCCILARRTRSLALGIQCMGRVLRWAPNKPQPLILDHAGFTLEFCGPMFNRSYSLKPYNKQEVCASMCKNPNFFPKGCGAVIDPGMIVCPDCKWEVGAIFCKNASIMGHCRDDCGDRTKILREEPACPVCGWEKPARAREAITDMEEKDTKLVELDEYKAEPESPLLQEYNVMKAEFEAENEQRMLEGRRPNRKGLLDERFFDKFNRHPPKGHKKPIVTKAHMAAIEFHDEMRERRKEERRRERETQKKESTT